MGGGGGGGGTFAGGGGGAGFGGGAGGRRGGGGGGGSYVSTSTVHTFIAGGGGAGGTTTTAGEHGSVSIYWNVNVPIQPPFESVNQFMLNAQHTGKSPNYGPTLLPSQIVTTSTNSFTFPNALVMNTANNMYIVSGDGVLYAFNSDLSSRWTYAIPNYKFIGTPLVSNDDTLYIAAKTTTSANYFFAIIDLGIGSNAGAAIKWQYLLDGNSSVSPVSDLSGVIYIGTDNGSLYAISDGYYQGLLHWRYPLNPDGIPLVGSPVFNLTYNRLTYTTYDPLTIISSLYVLNLSTNNIILPTLRWSNQLYNEIYGTPSIDNHSIIYVNTAVQTSATSNVYAYDISNNIQRWRLPIADTNLSTIAVGNDTTIYFTSQHGLNVIDVSNVQLTWVYPINPNGSTLPNSIPVIDANNTIYFGACDNNVYSLNTKQRTTNWYYTTGGAVQSMPYISDNNNIYIGSTDGNIYDFSGNGSTPVVGMPIVPMYMLNSQHTGVSSYTGSITANSIAWSADFVASNLFVLPSISIGYDGTLYLGSNDGWVYALNPTDGQSLPNWPVRVNNTPSDYQYTSPSSIYTTPIIAPDGTIYVGANQGYLYALTPTGQLKWSYAAGYPLQSSPMIDMSGSIYFGAGSCVYAIGDAGYRAYPKWLSPFTANANVISSPALGQNGYLYFGSDDGFVYAVDSFTGLLNWKFDCSTTLPAGVHPIYTSPTVDAANNVIIGNGSFMDGSLYYINGQSGNLLWSYNYENTGGGGPYYDTVAVLNNTIYLSTIAHVYAIERITGILKYRFYRANCYYTSPLIDANGFIYVASLDARTSHGILHSLRDTGSAFIENWKVDTGLGRLATPVMGSDGTIYVSSSPVFDSNGILIPSPTSNKIYAIR
jgi:outer membrane protein assembly factor BamB